MTALFVLAVVLGAIFAYGYIGVRLAQWDMPRAWERAKIAWSYEDTQTSSVRAQTWVMVALWPVVVLFRIAQTGTEPMIQKHNPYEHYRLQRRIEKLEREAGINR